MKVRQLIGARRIGVLAVAGVVALVVAAPSSGKTTASAAASKTPYVVGSLISETGPFGSSDGAGAYGIKAWASYVNAHGGINGHPVKLTVDDDQGNPTVAESDLKAFAANKNVLAIVGNVSSVGGTWDPVSQALKIPVVGNFDFAPAPYSNIFEVATTYASISYGMAYAAVKLNGANKVAFFYCAEEASCAASAPTYAGYVKALGASLVNTQSVSATAPNYDAQCLAAKNAGATAIVTGLGAGTVVEVAQSCSSIGYNPAFVSNTTALEPEFATAPGLNNALGVTSTFPWVANTTPAQKLFQTAIKAAHVPASAYGAALSLAYAGGVLFQTAAEKMTGTPSRAGLEKALWSLPKGDTLGGLAPPLYFKKNGVQANSPCFFIVKVHSGAWSTPYGTTAKFCQPAS
jgi:branched-chain amino acid transport system substrate-binding protein